ncbi:hypothetical protein BH10BAC6_BH10BAC6_04960 [soil metagenome]
MKTTARWIASAKIWVVIYPALTLFLYFTHDVLAGVPLYVRTFITTLVLVPVIVFYGVPTVDRILALFKRTPLLEKQ